MSTNTSRKCLHVKS